MKPAISVYSLYIATAYFNVGGWQLLREGLSGLGTFRLLVGDEPEAGADIPAVLLRLARAAESITIS